MASLLTGVQRLPGSLLEKLVDVVKFRASVAALVNQLPEAVVDAQVGEGSFLISNAEFELRDQSLQLFDFLVSTPKQLWRFQVGLGGS